jgi:hypothetical protein
MWSAGIKDQSMKEILTLLLLLLLLLPVVVVLGVNMFELLKRPKRTKREVDRDQDRLRASGVA